MKKIIIISIVVLMAVASLVVFYIFSNKKVATQVPEQKTLSEIPVLPGRENIEINEDDLKSEISKILLNQEKRGDSYSETMLKNQSGQNLPLENFINSENMEINKKVYDNLNQSNYQLFSCCSSGDVCKRGLILHVIEGGDGKEIVARYNNVNLGLTDWENTIIDDFKVFLFDNAEIIKQAGLSYKSTEYLTKNGANNIKIRYSNFKDQSGNDLSINYAFLDDKIFISNDKDCIRTTLDKYEDVLEP